MRFTTTTLLLLAMLPAISICREKERKPRGSTGDTPAANKKSEIMISGSLLFMRKAVQWNALSRLKAMKHVVLLVAFVSTQRRQRPGEGGRPHASEDGHDQR